MNGIASWNCGVEYRYAQVCDLSAAGGTIPFQYAR
jgi:hypothetical protein